MTEVASGGMTAEQRELLARLEALTIDEPEIGLPFTARLARENGWSGDFAARVVAEYRRFVFLAAAAGHPVTPSDEVDQAWHLHLVYTRSYWDDLCDGVLGFRLHHGPTRGGPAEGVKFNDWYERTLDSYRRLFGQEPPSDIWPPSKRRFADADRFRRINTAESWVVPKPRGLGRFGPAAVATGALALAGCAAAAANSSGTDLVELGRDGLSDEQLLWMMGGATLIIGVVIVRLLRAVARGRRGRSRGRAWGDSGCGGWSDGDSGCGSSGCGSSGCGGGGCGGCGS